MKLIAGLLAGLLGLLLQGGAADADTTAPGGVAAAGAKAGGASPPCTAPTRDDLSALSPELQTLVKALARSADADDLNKNVEGFLSSLKLPDALAKELSPKLIKELAGPGLQRARLQGAADLLEEAASTQGAAAAATTAATTAATAAAVVLRAGAVRLRRAASAATPKLLQVDAGGAKTRSVEVRLANPPTTRVRLMLDQVGGRAHAEVEWDPAVSSALVQRVALADGDWAVSVSVEPTFIQQGDGTIVIVTKFDDLDQSAQEITTRGTYTALVAGRSDPDARVVSMAKWPQPELAFRCGDAALQPIGEVELAPHLVARPSGQRANGVAPAIVAETLSIIAEITVERARSGAMALLKDRFVAPLCTNDDTRVTLKQLGLDESSELAFPLTCNTLESMRLEDVLSSGTTLLRSLREDARRTILPAAVARLAPAAPAMRALLQGVLQAVDRAIDRGAFDGLEIGLVLDLLGSADLLTSIFPEEPQQLPSDKLEPALKAALVIPRLFAAACKEGQTAEACARGITSVATTLRQWTNYLQIATRNASEGHRAVIKDLGDALAPHVQAFLAGKPQLAKAKDLVCRARLAIAVVKRCAGGACSTSGIADMLSRPEEHFARDTEFPATLCWEGGAYARTPEELAWVQRVVMDGLALVQPARQTSAREQAAGVIRLVAAVAAKMDPDSNLSVQRFTDLAVGLLEERYDAVLAGVLELAAHLAKTRTIPGLRKLAALGGAVATYVSVYNSTKESDAAAAREARKKSLESLIDAATDRHDRGHSWVVSLGSNVGVGGTYTTKLQDSGSSTKELAVRVPFGVAIQFLPSGDQKNAQGKRPWHRFMGFHSTLQLFDLGQFVRSDTADVKWSTFVAPGVELGLLIGVPNRAFSLAVHGAYAPALTADSTRGAWRIGLSIGFYVPFFDLH